MKYKLFVVLSTLCLLIGLSTLFSFSNDDVSNSLELNIVDEHITENCCSKEINSGKCTGSANCTACTSCEYCAHCSNGGSCGVCSPGLVSPSTPYVYKTKSSTTPTVNTYVGYLNSVSGYLRQEGMVGLEWTNNGGQLSTKMLDVDGLQNDVIVYCEEFLHLYFSFASLEYKDLYQRLFSVGIMEVQVETLQYIITIPLQTIKNSQPSK